MGHDVWSIARLRLDTSDIHITAAQLADRLGVRVRVVFRDFDKENWVQEEIEHSIVGHGDRRFTLCCDRDILPDGSRIVTEPGIYWDFYEDDNYDETEISIMRECFFANAHFASRWWSFCAVFTGEFRERQQWWLEYINTHRARVQTQCLALGGDSALYFDDQDVLQGLPFEEARTMSWEEIVATARTVAGEHWLDMSQWMRQYAETGVFVSDYPLVFYDDFSFGLPSESISQPFPAR